METLHLPVSRSYFDGKIAWLITIILVALAFPYLKNTFVSLLLKLYEFFIQRTAGG